MGDEPRTCTSTHLKSERDRGVDRKAGKKSRVKNASGTLRRGLFEGTIQGQGQSRRVVHTDPVPHPQFPGGGVNLGARKERKEQVTEERGGGGGNHGSLCQWLPKSSPLSSLTLIFALLN